MIDSFKKKKILVVVAHPDDEILGLGGTMHKLINNFECCVKVLILGEGLTSRLKNRDSSKLSNELKIHKSNIIDAGKVIGYDSFGIYDLPDNRFDTVPLLDIIKIVENEKKMFEPEIIFTHHNGDVNIDHQITFQAVTTACRPMSCEKVNTIITFETPSGTEWIASTDPRKFIPNLFIEINEEDLNAKIQGMESYNFEKRKFPHPRSPESLTTLAKYRGNSVGLTLAEAFSIVRIID